MASDPMAEFYRLNGQFETLMAKSRSLQAQADALTRKSPGTAEVKGATALYAEATKALQQAEALRGQMQAALAKAGGDMSKMPKGSSGRSGLGNTTKSGCGHKVTVYMVMWTIGATAIRAVVKKSRH